MMIFVFQMMNLALRAQNGADRGGFRLHTITSSMFGPPSAIFDDFRLFCDCSGSNFDAQQHFSCAADLGMF